MSQKLDFASADDKALVKAAQKGGMQAAGTWRHFDLGKNSVDYDVINPVTGNKIGVDRTSWYRNVTAIFFQDISFIKLREATHSFRWITLWISRAPSSSTPQKPGRVTVNELELFPAS